MGVNGYIRCRYTSPVTATVSQIFLIPKKQDGVNCPNEVELGCWGGAHDSLIANVCVLKNVRLKLKLKLISKLEKSMGAPQLLLDSGLFYSGQCLARTPARQPNLEISIFLWLPLAIDEFYKLILYQYSHIT